MAMIPFATAQDETLKEDPIVVLTGWGSPVGFSKAYNDYVYWRSAGGERVTDPNQACIQWHAGTFPYQIEMLRGVYAASQKVKGYERLYDSIGVYRLSEDGTTYIPIVEGAEPVHAADLDGAKIIPYGEYEGTGRTRRYGPDPRDGTNYLAGTYRIDMPNGVHDFYEMDLAYRPRIVGMMGWDPDKPAHYPDYVIERKKLLTGYIEEFFGGRIEWIEGYYSNVPGLTNHLKDTVPKVASQGYRKIVLAKPITDHNVYANVFWDRNLSMQSLCRAGYDTNEFDIRQVRMYGRTPEYNRMLLNNLNRHLEIIDPADEVAVIYNTHGLPWPGATPEGPMSNAMPWIGEVFHENSYLNFLSFKRYVEEFEDAYSVSFQKTGGEGTIDARTNNLFAYSEYDANKIGYADDPWRYLTLRDVIEDAVLNQEKKEVVVLLSHWGFTFWTLLIKLREAWEIPLNSIDEIKNGNLSKVWCEKYAGPGDFEQTEAVNNQCPDGFSRLQISEAFEDYVEDYTVNYANRIRGGLERFGILPDLDMEIAAKGPISRLTGGSVEVTQGPLKGAKLEVAADPRPGQPENFNWSDHYRPPSHENPNTGGDAIRAINEYNKMSDYFESAKDDFTALIGTQDKRTPDEVMPVHPSAVTPAVYFGPHRTLFNAPARVTLPYDPEKVSDPEKLRPYVFNEITRQFEAVPLVLLQQDHQLDTTDHAVSFQVQALGQYVLVEND